MICSKQRGWAAVNVRAVEQVGLCQTERDQEMEKGDRGVPRAWSVSCVINDSWSHRRDPDPRYISAASGRSHLRDFLVKVNSPHLIKGPPKLCVNETANESAATDPVHIGSLKVHTWMLSVNNRPSLSFKDEKEPREGAWASNMKANGPLYLEKVSRKRAQWGK